MRDREQITQWLDAWQGGDRSAFDHLVGVLRPDLTRLAQSYLTGERANHTLQATELVHEAYLRLMEHDRIRWKSRGHFLAVAATTMRRILVDHARRRSAAKRGGGSRTITLVEQAGGTDPREVDLIALDRALERLAEADPTKSRLIELRFFGGLTVEEAADILAMSRATANRQWMAARLWLFRELSEEVAT